jgi:hypothetical protein
MKPDLASKQGVPDYHRFLRQKLLYGKQRVRTVILQNSRVGEKFWPHTTNSLSHVFETSEIILPAA